MNAKKLREIIAEIRFRVVRTEKGRWKLWGGDVMADPKDTGEVKDAIVVARCPLQPNEHGGSHVGNAYYIQAAQPENVLALIDALEAARPELKA